jgi:3-oxoacyl-[acyl-carrier protein] reductase
VAGAAQPAHDQVVITGRRPEPLELAAAELGDNARAVRFDAADPAEVARAMAELPEIVNVLVNNAGGNTDIGAPNPTSLDELAAAWRANLDANLISAVLVTTAGRRLLLRREGRGRSVEPYARP